MERPDAKLVPLSKFRFHWNHFNFGSDGININVANDMSLGNITAVSCHDHRSSNMWLHFAKERLTWTLHSATPATNLFHAREGALQTWKNTFASCTL